MWPPLFACITLLSLAHAESQEDENLLKNLHFDFQRRHYNSYNIDELVEPYINITTVEKIFAEESERLGVTPRQHLLACKDPSRYYIHFFGNYPKQSDVDFLQKLYFIEKAAKSDARSHFARINTTTEAIETFKAIAPKTFGIVSKEINSYISKLDSDAKEFVVQTGDIILESMMQILWIAGSFSDYEKGSRVNARFNEHMVAYKALSQSAKDSIDRVFCTRTIMRMMGKDCEDSSMWINNFNNIVRSGDFVIFFDFECAK